VEGRRGVTQMAESLLERMDGEDADAATCERFLVETIRQLADLKPGIGKDCMSVCVPPFSAPEVLYRTDPPARTSAAPRPRARM
jgi:hypothetical protein